MITNRDIVIYILLVLIFGCIAFFVLEILFHPHATPFSAETIEKIYVPSLVMAFAFVFILPIIMLRNRKKAATVRNQIKDQ